MLSYTIGVRDLDHVVVHEDIYNFFSGLTPNRITKVL